MFRSISTKLEIECYAWTFFYCDRWITGTDPDLVFANVNPNSRLPDRRVLEKYPNHNIDLCLLCQQNLLCQYQECLLKNRLQENQMELLYCCNEQIRKDFVAA